MLQDSLETLVRLIERVAPGMRGSVLLLDDDGVTFDTAPPQTFPVIIVGRSTVPASARRLDRAAPPRIDMSG